ncbi:MAG: CDP-alcohol phosphatidyltransferase family protein [Bacilli bacterium]|nr:CDP-alcohol phosphatidyltransferase family protein [Bacilli bacterium]
MFLVKFNKSVIVTYLGVIFAVISMYFALTKMAFSEICYLRYSLIFLILSGVCDMFDGKIARACKRTEEEKIFGIQIDSLADTVDFVCLPVVIMLSLGMHSIIDVIAYALLIICGISRLGYFNINATTDVPVKYYNGLPVTSTAITYPIFGLLHGTIPDDIFKIIYLALTFVTAILFVYKFKVPKLKGKAYVIIPILAIILAVLLLVVR